MMPAVATIVAHELGELDERQTLELFAELVRTGQAWSLQGHYGRTAMMLLEGGYIDQEGNVLADLGEQS
jgi:hypothetical protein